MCYTYMVECSDGSLYTGWTKDLEKRLCAHNAKKGAKYTKSRTPVKLVYYEHFDTKEAAMRRENEVKGLTRKEKIALIGKEDRTKEITVNNYGNADESASLE